MQTNTVKMLFYIFIQYFRWVKAHEKWQKIIKTLLKDFILVTQEIAMIDSTWDFQDRVRIVNFHENIFYKLSMFSFKTVNIVFSTCNTNSIHAN